MAGLDSYNVLMLHGEGVANFTDTSPIGRDPIKTNCTSDAVTYKFADYGMAFTGSASYATLDNHTDYEFGTGNFTIDCQFRLNSLTGIQNFIGYGTTASGVQFFYDGTDNKFKVYAFSTIILETAADLVAINEWHHWAYVRYGNNHRIYIDGTYKADTTNSGSYGVPNHANKIKIGAETTLPSQFFNGYMDEFRISKGIARWTGNFTAPVAEYTVASVVSFTPRIIWF